MSLPTLPTDLLRNDPDDGDFFVRLTADVVTRQQAEREPADRQDSGDRLVAALVGRGLVHTHHYRAEQTSHQTNCTSQAPADATAVPRILRQPDLRNLGAADPRL